MKKKTLILSILLLITILVIYNYDSNNTKSENKVVTKDVTIKTKRKIQYKKPTKKNKVFTEHKFSIDNFHPCELFNVQEVNLWMNLPKSSSIFQYKTIERKVLDFSDRSTFVSTDFDELEQYFDRYFDNVQYLPFYTSIINVLKNIHSSTPSTNKRLESIIQNIENTLFSKAMSLHELEPHLFISKLEHDFEDYDTSISIINSIDLDSHNNSLYEDFYNRAMKEAQSPNQLAITMIELNHAPTPDFSHLIDLKERNQSKEFQKKLDQISMGLIKNRLISKRIKSTDFHSYSVALKINSKKDWLEKKFGKYKDLQNKIIKKEVQQSPYSSTECDDRQIIDLCDKYCNK